MRDIVASDPYVKIWLGRLSNAETRRGYIRDLAVFCQFVGQTPTEIITQRLQDIRSEDIPTRVRYEQKVVEWYDSLKKAPNTKNRYYCSVRSFFQFAVPGGPLELGGKLIRMSREQVKSSGKPKIEEARIIMDSFRDLGMVMERAIGMMMKDGGFREETLARLQVKDIDRESGYPWIVITKKCKSGDRGYFSFMGEESGKALMAYWKLRGDSGRNPELPVFSLSNGEPASNRYLVDAMYSGFKKLKNRGIIRKDLRPYGLRKLFQTQCEVARIDPNWIKKMMAHNLGGVEGAYSQAELEDARRAYEIAYDYLRLYPRREQYSEDAKARMRTVVRAIREAMPTEFQNIANAETLANGDSLWRTVLREETVMRKKIPRCSVKGCNRRAWCFGSFRTGLRYFCWEHRKLSYRKLKKRRVKEI